MNDNTQEILEKLVYQVLYKHTDNYWDENGRIKVIYAGERMPMVSDCPNQLDNLLAISSEIAKQILTAQGEEDEADDWFIYGTDGRRHKLAKPSDVTVTIDQLVEWVKRACEPDKEYTNTYIVPIRKLERFLRNPQLWEHAFTPPEEGK